MASVFFYCTSIGDDDGAITYLKRLSQFIYSFRSASSRSFSLSV